MFLLGRDGTYLDYQPTRDVRPYVPPSEFLGRRVLDILPNTVGVPCQYLIGQALATGQMQRLEYELDLEGMPYQYEARIVPSGADEVLAMVRDISSGEGPLLAVRQAEADFRSTFGDCTHAVALVDGVTIAFGNSAMADLFGYENAASLKNLCILDLIAPEGRKGMDRLLRVPLLRPTARYRARGIRGATTFPLYVRASEYERGGRIYTVLRFRNLHRPSSKAICAPARPSDAGPDSLSGHPEYSASKGFPHIVAPQYTSAESLAGSILTARELQVLILIASGQSTKQLAAALGIAYKTADAHRTHLMEKLGVHETASMVRYAIRNGLVEP